jgi:hypothetical protein
LLRAALHIAAITLILGIAFGVVAALAGPEWILQFAPGLAGGVAGGLGALWLQRTIAAQRLARAHELPPGR